MLHLRSDDLTVIPERSRRVASLGEIENPFHILETLFGLTEMNFNPNTLTPQPHFL